MPVSNKKGRLGLALWNGIEKLVIDFVFLFLLCRLKNTSGFSVVLPRVLPRVGETRRDCNASYTFRDDVRVR